MAPQGEARRRAPYQLRDRTSEDSHRRSTSDGSIASAGVLAGTHEEDDVRQHAGEQEDRHADKATVHHRTGTRWPEFLETTLQARAPCWHIPRDRVRPSGKWY
jgi:hypothetical protein